MACAQVDFDCGHKRAVPRTTNNNVDLIPHPIGRTNCVGIVGPRPEVGTGCLCGNNRLLWEASDHPLVQAIRIFGEVGNQVIVRPLRRGAPVSISKEITSHPAMERRPINTCASGIV